MCSLVTRALQLVMFIFIACVDLDLFYLLTTVSMPILVTRPDTLSSKRTPVRQGWVTIA